MQQQLEIKFFYPLTEQIPLDLDFNHFTGNRIDYRASDGTITMPQSVFDSFVVKPNKVHIGKWEVSESMFVYRSTKPNAINRFFAKLLLGFKWHDEI